MKTLWLSVLNVECFIAFTAQALDMDMAAYFHDETFVSNSLSVSFIPTF